MKTRLFRSFSSELLKIAGELGDADIRKLLAERKGEEYLVGGELPSNSQTAYAPNVRAGSLLKAANTSLASLTPAMLNFKAEKKDNTPYQKVRDWGWRGVQGAAAGTGISQLVKNMKGHHMHPRDYRRAAAMGAGIAIGDRLWRHRQELSSKKTEKKTEEKIAGIVSPAPGKVVGSPAERLAAAMKTGRFRKQVHVGKPPHGIRVGNKFQMPGAS